MISLSCRACGARRTELAGLTVGAYRSPVVTIQRKGGWTQVVKVDGRTAAMLDRWLGWRGGAGEDPMFTQVRHTVEDRWIAGPGLSGAGVAEIVVTRAKEAGIRRRVGPHLLRHTFVSTALAAGVPAHRVMVAAGHKSIATTSRYVTDLRQETEPLGDAIDAFLIQEGQPS